MRAKSRTAAAAPPPPPTGRANAAVRVAAGFFLGAVLSTAGYLAFDYLSPGSSVATTASPLPREEKPSVETLAERVARARERSKGIKGVYMSAGVANDRGRAATKLRDDIIALIAMTELNAVVIDVKETEGGLIITDELRGLIRALHDMGAWVIARQVVFKDSSQEATHPEWYLNRSDAYAPDGSPRIWRDRRGGSWLDPSLRPVWEYQRSVAVAAADAGFDEIQFDYIRFPSDGNLATIVYPNYRAEQPKHAVLKEFFRYLHDELKTYRPELILSADFFGYVAIQGSDLGIGQRLADIGETFDYLSLMVYPSHYYAGFEVPADHTRNLPAVFLPYRSSAPDGTASGQPYAVVYRSLLAAGDALSALLATGTAKAGADAPATGTSTDSGAAAIPEELPLPSQHGRLRPWLQDFDLAADSKRGIYYDAEKVRAQIAAAEDAGSSGWLLWNAANVYTKEALKPE